MTRDSLVDRHLGFVQALREAGLPVSLAEGLDAAGALTVIDLTDRDTLREAYAATLVKRPSYRPAFNVLFDLWFPPMVSGSYGTGAGERRDGAVDLEHAEIPRLRDRLADLLMDDPDDPAFR